MIFISVVIIRSPFCCSRSVLGWSLWHASRPCCRRATSLTSSSRPKNFRVERGYFGAQIADPFKDSYREIIEGNPEKEGFVWVQVGADLWIFEKNLIRLRPRLLTFEVWAQRVLICFCALHDLASMRPLLVWTVELGFRQFEQHFCWGLDRSLAWEEQFFDVETTHRGT